ncbi:hypothetical protein JAAARDRAFT_52974 [Jaapia argillacea MUCL 33604]|uniref:SH3 domain-containing protein n=1 Tax=Jaapia argillacea MUCL 33604 TaxID=933084 RepID=A0A067QND1_9AGAM|nr:hypothetical protein JAAARDRAFT_52974 [Jaapia argillacea MUCL 33604]
MVFSTLSSDEKDAFFSLLDEYFSSRPDLLAGASAGQGRDLATPAVAATAVHRALASNPEATSRLVSAGLKHGASNPAITNSVGKVAAAAAAFGTRNPAASSTPSPPPPLAHRTSDNDTPERPAPGHNRTSSTQNLVSIKRFGDVDTSSAKNMFSSLRGSTANKTATPPPIAPPASSAFGQKKQTFAPPPVRRVSSSPSTESEQPSRGPPPAPPRRQQVEEEPEVEGEWAEALYDYSSEDPGDMELQANQRVLIVERTSGDWWTGEMDGKRGLVPASYVRLL